MGNKVSGLSSLWSLAGHWKVSRVIEHADGTRNSFEGSVVFRRSGPRLIQSESGVLTVGNQQFQGARKYVWDREGDLLRVHFDDMRPFHTVPLESAHVETAHLCPPDRYEVAYDFSDWPMWRSVWRVEGPRKDYVMTSQHRPVTEADITGRN